LAAEADRLEASAKEVAGLRMVSALYHGRRVSELRGLAQLLRDRPGMVAVLASYTDGKLTMVTASAAETGVDAREFLRQHLQPLGLQGGGDASIAQGGGLVDESRLGGLFERSQSYISGAGTALS
jgi:alanyl-tRNA synthetase